MNQYCQSGDEVRPRATTIPGKFRTWLRHAYLSTASVWPQPSSKEFVRCIYGHYVFADQVSQFRQLIRELRSHGEIISSDTLAEIIRDGRPDGRYFHLSFDDGFKNVATIGASVLNETQSPSTFFVPADVIGRTGEEEVEFSRGTAHPGRAIQLADWDDLRAARDSGMTIGCHTMTHARLSMLADPQDLKREITDSKAVIERELGQACDYFSWPFGRNADISNQALDLIRATGYRACFSAIRGSVDRQTDLFRIPRHHFELYWPMSHIRYFVRGRGEP